MISLALVATGRDGHTSYVAISTEPQAGQPTAVVSTFVPQSRHSSPANAWVVSMAGGPGGPN